MPVLGLWHGAELVDDRIARIQEVAEPEAYRDTPTSLNLDKDKLKDAVVGMLDVIRGQPILAEISLEKGMLEQIFRCIESYQVGRGDEELVDNLSALACELLGYRRADSHLQRCLDDNEEDIPFFFRRLIEVLLTPIDVKASGWQSHQAALAFYNTVLDRIPSSAFHVQQCLVGHPAEG